MVNFGYPYNDIVICKDSTDYLTLANDSCFTRPHKMTDGRAAVDILPDVRPCTTTSVVPMQCMHCNNSAVL